MQIAPLSDLYPRAVVMVKPRDYAMRRMIVLFLLEDQQQLENSVGVNHIERDIQLFLMEKVNMVTSHMQYIIELYFLPVQRSFV